MPLRQLLIHESRLLLLLQTASMDCILSEQRLIRTYCRQLNQTLDTFSSLTGELTGLLNGVPSTSEQLKAVLNQLDTSLSDVKSALTGTKSALASVSDRLDDIQSDVNAIISSEAYQKLLSLEGIDADTIASFMESPVELETETYFEVANYGSSMIPFYTNLAIWVGGIVLIAILKME